MPRAIALDLNEQRLSVLSGQDVWPCRTRSRYGGVALPLEVLPDQRFNRGFPHPRWSLAQPPTSNLDRSRRPNYSLLPWSAFAISRGTGNGLGQIRKETLA